MHILFEKKRRAAIIIGIFFFLFFWISATQTLDSDFGWYLRMGQISLLTAFPRLILSPTQCQAFIILNMNG